MSIELHHAQPWWEPPDWLDSAEAWVAGELARRGRSPSGAMQLVKNWGISCLLRVPTSAGDLYFKAVPPLFAREGMITVEVATFCPEHAPTVVAVEPARRWLLLEDFGPRRLESEALPL